MTVRNLAGVYGQPFPKESNGLPSKTVPDMSMSLRQMLDRHNRGGAVKTFDPVFLTGDDPLIPVGMENMDAFEKWKLKQDLGDFIEVQRGKLISARQLRQKQAHDLEVANAVSERLAKIAVEASQTGA